MGPRGKEPTPQLKNVTPVPAQRRDSGLTTGQDPYPGPQRVTASPSPLGTWRRTFQGCASARGEGDTSAPNLIPHWGSNVKERSASPTRETSPPKNQTHTSKMRGSRAHRCGPYRKGTRTLQTHSGGSLPDPLSVQPVLGRDAWLSPKPALTRAQEPTFDARRPGRPRQASPPPAGRAEEGSSEQEEDGVRSGSGLRGQGPRGTVDKPAASFGAGAQEARSQHSPESTRSKLKSDSRKAAAPRGTWAPQQSSL